MPDDIQRIDTLVDEIITRVAAQAVLAADDAAFKAVYDAAVRDFENAGLSVLQDFWKQNLADAIAEIHG